MFSCWLRGLDFSSSWGILQVLSVWIFCEDLLEDPHEDTEEDPGEDPQEDPREDPHEGPNEDPHEDAHEDSKEIHTNMLFYIISYWRFFILLYLIFQKPVVSYRSVNSRLKSYIERDSTRKRWSCVMRVRYMFLVCRK